jgi:hypothetical protein
MNEQNRIKDEKMSKILFTLQTGGMPNQQKTRQQQEKRRKKKEE